MAGQPPAGIPGSPGPTNIGAMPYGGVPPNFFQQQLQVGPAFGAMGGATPEDTRLGPPQGDMPSGPKNEDVRTGPASKYPNYQVPPSIRPTTPSFISGQFPDFNQQALALAGAPAAGGPTIQTNPEIMGGGPIGFQPNIPGTTLPFYQNPMGEQLTTGAEMIGELQAGMRRGGRGGPRQNGVGSNFSQYGQQPVSGYFTDGAMDQMGMNPGANARLGGGRYRR